MTTSSAPAPGVSSAATDACALAAGQLLADALPPLKLLGAIARPVADRLLMDAILSALPARHLRVVPRPSTRRTPARTTTTTRTSLPPELAFLNDPRISVHEKIFRLLQYFQEKSDKELAAKVKEYSDKVEERKRLAEGGGALGPIQKAAKALKAFMPGLAAVSAILQNPLGGKLLSELGGPIFGAAATACGMPALAPLASKYGPEIVGAAVNAEKELGGLDGAAKLLDQLMGNTPSSVRLPTPGTTTTGTTTAGTGGSTSGTKATTSKEYVEADEKKLATEFQYLMQRQQTLTGALSACMKIMHDTDMAVVNNIR
jgi:hypothetical protein